MIGLANRHFFPYALKRTVILSEAKDLHLPLTGSCINRSLLSETKDLIP